MAIKMIRFVFLLTLCLLLWSKQTANSKTLKKYVNTMHTFIFGIRFELNYKLKNTKICMKMKRKENSKDYTCIL